MNFARSNELRDRFQAVIPGGAHTYAKGDDQYPENARPYIVRGRGCRVWDLDGNEFIEYGAGLRAVGLGHSFPAVVAGVEKVLRDGTNFVRPTVMELEAAELLKSVIPGAEMVKFCKDGTDANSGAVRLSRAVTGRNLIAICGDHPFFAQDDWFIGTTPMSAGIPKVISDMTLKFRYNDIGSLERLFDEHPNDIACVMLEPEKDVPPREDFLRRAKDVSARHGAVFILDEMITGFRWHLGGGQAYHDITPDLSTFGKSMGNGFPVSALVGRRDLMKVGGLDHDQPRVFLLSATHGADTPSLAAAMATIDVYRREPVVEALWSGGERLSAGFRKAVAGHGLEEYVKLSGRPCCLTYGTLDGDKKPSQPFRTLFLQETIRRGVLAPSLVVNYSHTEEDIDRTLAVIEEALGVYAKAIREGISKYLDGRPVKPVFRSHN